MAKTKYQQAGTDYAREYLDKLLEMEDYVGRKLDHIVEQKVRKYVKPGSRGEADGREADKEAEK